MVKSHSYSTICIKLLYACACSVASVVSNSATLWTVAHQAPQSMRFSRQEDWSGLPISFPEDLPDLGIKPEFPAFHCLSTEPPGKALKLLICFLGSFSHGTVSFSKEATQSFHHCISNSSTHTQWVLLDNWWQRAGSTYELLWKMCVCVCVCVYVCVCVCFSGTVRIKEMHMECILKIMSLHFMQCKCTCYEFFIFIDIKNIVQNWLYLGKGLQ